MERLALLLCLCLITAACASTDRAYGRPYPPLPPAATISVFGAESEINEPFAVVGEIYYDNRNPFQVLGRDDAVAPLKQEARAIGANGLILGLAEPVESGIIWRGIYAEALAIRLTGRSP